jgi:hypothetical protein
MSFPHDMSVAPFEAVATYISRRVAETLGAHDPAYEGEGQFLLVLRRPLKARNQP